MSALPLKKKTGLLESAQFHYGWENFIEGISPLVFVRDFRLVIDWRLVYRRLQFQIQPHEPLGADPNHDLHRGFHPNQHACFYFDRHPYLDGYPDGDLDGDLDLDADPDHYRHLGADANHYLDPNRYANR